jgi:hypothetical protein
MTHDLTGHIVQEKAMSKTYTTPALVAKGNVVELTRFSVPGEGDPINAGKTLGTAPGNVGFQL